MKFRISDKQFVFLKTYLSKERPDLFAFFSKDNGTDLEINEDIACEIRDWASEKLQAIGFDIYYKLTYEGAILEDLIDLFYM